MLEQSPLCERCGLLEEQHDIAMDQAAAALGRAEASMEDLRNAERELRRLRRRVKELERELYEKHATDPLAAVAKAVFEHWNGELRAGKARAFTGKRLSNVMDRLHEGYTADDLKLAVAGAKASAYVKDGHRYDDLELICRDPTIVDRFMAKAGTREPLAPIGWHPKAKALVDALVTLYGPGTRDQWGDSTSFPCPACEAGEDETNYRPFQVRHDGRHVICNACGSDPRYLVYSAKRRLKEMEQ